MVKGIILNLLIFSTIFVCTARSQENKGIKIIYYSKVADGGRVADAISNLNGFLEIPAPSNFYDEKGLGSNAILCGAKAEETDAISVFSALTQAGIQIRYFGSYYRYEKNALQNVVSIRSINSENYNINYRPLTLQDIKSFDGALCGIGEGVEIKVDGVADNFQIKKYDDIYSKEIADSLVKALMNDGARNPVISERQTRDGTVYSLKVEVPLN